MYILAAFFFWLIGITMVLKPQLVIQLRDSLKYTSQAEPSKWYLRSTRFGGVMFLLAGILSFVVQFMK